MPTAPALSPEQAQLAQATGSAGSVNPSMFLVAAAQMHGEGSLSMPTGPKEDLQTGKRPRSKLRILR